MKTTTTLSCALFGLLTIALAPATWANTPLPNAAPGPKAINKRCHPTPVDPKAIAKRCLRQMTTTAEKSVRGNRYTAARCVAAINKLQANGQHRAAKRHARSCIRRIHQRSEANVKQISKLCRKCVEALRRLHASGLARRVAAESRKLRQKVSDSEARAIKAICKAVRDLATEKPVPVPKTR